MKQNFTDALCNKLHIGKTYVYSKNDNGFTTSIIGELTSINEKTVSLKVLSHKRQLYGDEFSDVNDKKKTISVKPWSLVPVQDTGKTVDSITQEQINYCRSELSTILSYDTPETNDTIDDVFTCAVSMIQRLKGSDNALTILNNKDWSNNRIVQDEIMRIKVTEGY